MRGGPLRIATRVLAWFDRPEGRTLRLLLFGLVLALLGTFELARVHPAPWTLQSGRLNGLQWTLDVLNRGGPILTSQIPGTHALFRAGDGDDQGLYLFVPWVAHALGSGDPLNVLRWMAVGSFALPITLYPWLIRELSGSTLAGLGSPFALLLGLWLIPLADIYWVAAWAVLALLPLVLLLDRRWGRYGLAVLLGVLVLASFASAFRSQAGLPVLVGAVLVLVRRPWSRWLRAGGLVLCLIAYLSVSTFGMAAVRAERDHQLGQRELVGTDMGTRHPFWHTAYVGLGYLPNRWDIRFQDQVGYRDVLRVDPNARFQGPSYVRILRKRYFRIIRDDPGFAVRDYGAKLLVALRPAAPALLAMAILCPWLLLVDARRARWRRDAVFILIAAVVGLASPMLATPFSVYLMGWLAAVLLSAILACAAVVADWPAAVAYARTLRPRGPLPRPRRAVVGAMAVGVTAVVAVLLAAPPVEHKALRWNAQPPPHVVQPRNPTN
jgi:hypothetical protein